MIYLHESLASTLEIGRSKRPGGRQRGVVAEVPVGVSGAQGGEATVSVPRSGPVQSTLAGG